MTDIINNILYAIDAFGKQLKFLIKLIISVPVFFFLAKSLTRLTCPIGDPNVQF